MTNNQVATATRSTGPPRPRRKRIKRYPRFAATWLSDEDYGRVDAAAHDQEEDFSPTVRNLLLLGLDKYEDAMEKGDPPW